MHRLRLGVAGELSGCHAVADGWVLTGSAVGGPPQLRRIAGSLELSVRSTSMVTELEEALMPILGGMDIHRKQLAFDYVDTETGRL
jgi:hypothetical protein